MPAQTQDRLALLMFLVGRWHGEVQSGAGRFRFEASIQRRGGWLLHRTDVRDDHGHCVFQSTWLWGVEVGEFVCYVFDSAGVFRFTGIASAAGLQFEWNDGENQRRFWYEPRLDGTIYTKYEAHVPMAKPPFPADVVFEGVLEPARQ